ncbi:MAG: hypothetical protein ACI97A_003176 [Planctomycetota bacterium]
MEIRRHIVLNSPIVTDEQQCNDLGANLKQRSQDSFYKRQSLIPIGDSSHRASAGTEPGTEPGLIPSGTEPGLIPSVWLNRIRCQALGGRQPHGQCPTSASCQELKPLASSSRPLRVIKGRDLPISPIRTKDPCAPSRHRTFTLVHWASTINLTPYYPSIG